MFDLIKYCMNKGKGGSGGGSSGELSQTSVSLDSFISAALIGLGLSPQAGNNTAFDQIVTNCKEWLQTATIDGLEIVSTASGLALTLISPVDGSFYVKKNILEGIKDWLFDSGSTESVISDYVWEGNSFVPSRTFYASAPVRYCPCIAKDGNDYWAYILFISTNRFTTSAGNPTLHNSANGYYIERAYLKFYRKSLPTDFPYELEIEGSFVDASNAYSIWIHSRPLDYVFPDNILPASVIPKVGEDIEITYIDWKELEKQVQEGDGSSEDPTDPTNPAPIPLVPYWPIWSPQFSNPDSTLDNVTQSDVWQSGSDPNWNPGSNIENKNSSPILWWGKIK